MGGAILGGFHDWSMFGLGGAIVLAGGGMFLAGGGLVRVGGGGFLLGVDCPLIYPGPPIPMVACS